MITAPHIVQIALTFTLLLPIWQEQPLTTEHLSSGPVPTHITAELLAAQKTALAQPSLGLRRDTIVQLARTGNPDAARLILEHSTTETEPSVLATCLLHLVDLPGDPRTVAAAIVPHLTHADPTVRLAAIRLYGGLQGHDTTHVVAVAAADALASVRLAAWRVLARESRFVRKDVLESALATDDPHLRSLVVAAICGGPHAASMSTELQTAAAPAAPLLVRVSLARNCSRLPAKLAADLIKQLAQDPNATVRAATADAIAARVDQLMLPILIELASDQQSSVRLQAAAGLAVFPHTDTAETLAALMGDTSVLVREQAEESSVAIHANLPVDQIVASQLGSDDANQRYHAYRVLGRVGVTQHGPQALARGKSETRASNIAAAIYAVGQLDVKDAAGFVAANATHGDPTVQAEVATALGILNQPETYPVLARLVVASKGDVCCRGLESMGRIGDAHAFASPVLTVLKDVKTRLQEERATAAWAAARLKPVSTKLIDRMFVITTKPTISVPMSPPVFDGELCLVSCDFALAHLAKADPSLNERLRPVLRLHQVKVDAAQDTNPNALIPSEQLNEYARQAEAYLLGRTIEPGKPSPSTAIFSFRPMDSIR